MPPPDIEHQLVTAYRRLVEATGRRPHRAGAFASFSAEARAWARDWWAQEEDDRFFTGCPDYMLRPTMAALVEAARACCDCSPLDEVRQLIEHAVMELAAVEQAEATS